MLSIVKKNLSVLFFNFIVVLIFGALLGNTFASANGEFAYIGRDLYSVDSGTGQLTYISTLGPDYNYQTRQRTLVPSFYDGMVFHPNGEFAYIGRDLYSVESETGQLTRISSLGSGFNDQTGQRNLDPYYYDGMVFHPNGEFAYTGRDLYSVDSETGQLTRISSLGGGFNDQTGQRTLGLHSYCRKVFHPNGEFAYTGRDLYSVDSETGQLTRISSLGDSFYHPIGQLTTYCGMVFHPNGKIAYIDHDIYSVDSETGQLTHISPGYGFRRHLYYKNMVFHPNGKTAYIGGSRYSVDSETGRLTYISSSDDFNRLVGQRPPLTYYPYTYTFTYNGMVFFRHQRPIHKQADNLMEDFFNKPKNSSGYLLVEDALKWSKQKIGRNPLDYLIIRMGGVVKDKYLAKEIKKYVKKAKENLKNRTDRLLKITNDSHLQNLNFQERANSLLTISNDLEQSNGLLALEADIKKQDELESKIIQLQSKLDQVNSDRIKLLFDRNRTANKTQIDALSQLHLMIQEELAQCKTDLHLLNQPMSAL